MLNLEEKRRADDEGILVALVYKAFITFSQGKNELVCTLTQPQ